MALSLQKRIWGWSAGITLAVLFVFFSIADSSFRGTIRAGLEQNVRSALTLANQVRSSQLDDLIRRTTNFAQDPRLKGAVDTQDPPTIVQVLEEELAIGGLDWFAVFSVDGTPLARTAGAPIGKARRGDNLLRDAQFYDTGDLWITDQGVTDVAASPILFGNVGMGILVAGTGVDSAAVRDIETYAQQRVAILSGGRVVVGDARIAGAASSSSRIITDRDVSEFRVDGESFLGIEGPLMSAAGRAVASMLVFHSLDAALAPARSLRLTLLGIAFVGLGLAFLLALLLSRGVTAPVSRLLEDAERLGAGDLQSPILPMRSDEIGQLAEGFDRMRVSLKEAQDELIHAERLSAVGQMASSIVHDFGNPLAAIRMNAELMAMDAGEAEEVESAQDIIREADRMNAMMREVLEFARGDRRLDRTDVDLHAWMCEVERFWAPVLEQHGITIRVLRGYEGAWTFDAERLRRVIDNLIKNAQGAVSRGGTIAVRTACTPRGLRVEVADDGRGIPCELHESLFQPFTTHGKKDGTGLGLAICKSVVERHGGSIDFVSSPVGTTFAIEIPEGGEPCVDAA